MAGLILLALSLSVYLSWHSLAGGLMIGCAGGSACEKVLTSRWSTIGGILPVSALATGAYLAMLVASFFIGPATLAPVRRLAWAVLLVLVGSAAGSAVWFTILQKWVIGAFCPYCTTAHITGLLLVLLVCGVPARAYFEGNALRRHYKLGLLLIGLVLAGVLATSQVIITPPAVYRGGASQAGLPALDPHTVPLVGAPEAPYVVTLLFDYKCPHCQAMHFMLDEVVRRYNGKLAFALCPVPLNTQCNPYIPRDVEAYKDSCELAKIGLAVWGADRAVFRAFDLWMFSWESGDRWRPRRVDEAKAKAMELVGPARFDAARIDPWIDRYLQTCVRIYGTTIQGGNNAVPKLVFGSRWVIPEPRDADDLIRILQTSLALPTP